MQEKLIEIAKTLDILKYMCYVETPDNQRLSLSSGDVALSVNIINSMDQQ